MGQVFRKAEQYLDQFDPDYIGQFIEIGTSRKGDGGSTKTIAEWASRFGKCLWTVDMDSNNCNYVIEQDIPNLTVVNQTGESYLEQFPKHITYISFLYLDNFDWDWHPAKEPEHFIVEQQQRYRSLGYDMNNLNSQRAHLRQVELALPALGDKCIVACDDTWYNKWWGHYSGKCGSAIPLLLNHGFEVLYTADEPEYGTILGRGIK